MLDSTLACSMCEWHVNSSWCPSQNPRAARKPCGRENVHAPLVLHNVEGCTHGPALTKGFAHSTLASVGGVFDLRSDYLREPVFGQLLLCAGQ